jgi:5'-nucleotidase
MRLVLDMDGVIADFMKRWLEQYNHLTGENVQVNDITGPKTSKFVKDPHTLYRLKDAPGFIRSLEPMPGAIDGVHELHSKGHEIIFLSNGTRCPSSGHEKREWLFYYFHRLWKIPPLILAYAGHKKYVPGDVLLEDTPKNLENLEYGTKALLFHNRSNAEETRFERIYDWSHFLQWVDENKERYETKGF